ncbi:hypothetical protein [Streptomyces sp. CB02959]|uniref:hypothetical protein n=1 Tax=Streptomyces sp. CB02959 TaxID=2020330 RepID=UPI000C27E1E1|nr:hypothetical protein [Streptomyces sp. CB02959]PJN38350.1 hypothetical protein CG747_24105 [Streptomyces sp. CB02959]
MTTRRSQSANWRKKITDHALAQVRGCLRDPEVYRELKEIADRTISPEYHRRCLVELLQDAHDAHLARSVDGRGEVVLDEQKRVQRPIYGY